MSQSITCPISSERIEEGTIRIIALLTAIVAIYALFLMNGYLFVFLTIDFAIRSFKIFKGKSPLRIIASTVIEITHQEKKWVDAAPKRFAAGIGIVLSMLIASSIFFHLNTFALILGGILVFCAALEGFFSICFGCHIYSKIILPISKFIK